MRPNYNIPLRKGCELSSNGIDNTISDDFSWCSREVIQHLRDYIMDLVLKIGLQLLVGIAASDDFDMVVFFVLDVEFLDEL